MIKVKGHYINVFFPFPLHFIHYFPVFVIPKPIKVEVSVIASGSADGQD